MNAQVDVIVDPDDTIATVHAIHTLAGRHEGTLVIRAPPKTRSGRVIEWGILRALGKRLDTMPPGYAVWHHAEHWITAHQIREMFVLCAQHLDPNLEDELQDFGRRTQLSIVLVHGGPPSRHHPATTTIEGLVNRPRSALSLRGTAYWPNVPESHPLRLRYDCAWSLTINDFRLVEELHFDAYNRLTRWLRIHPNPDPCHLGVAMAVVLAGEDSNQRRIRRSAVEIAMATEGVGLPAIAKASFPRPTTSTHKLDEVLTDAHPQRAGYTLAKLTTGLQDDLLALIGGDQITDVAILGCTVPHRARPILRALDRRPTARLDVPTRRQATALRERNPDSPRSRRSSSRASTSEATILRQLLCEPRGCVAARRIRKDDRQSVDQFVSHGLVAREGEVYRATRIALYSAYRLVAAPPLLTNE